MGGGPQDYSDSPSPILTLNNWDFLVFDSNGLDLGLGLVSSNQKRKTVYSIVYIDMKDGSGTIWVVMNLLCSTYIHGQQLLILKWIRIHLNLEIKSNKGLTFIYKLQ